MLKWTLVVCQYTHTQTHIHLCIVIVKLHLRHKLTYKETHPFVCLYIVSVRGVHPTSGQSVMLI